MLVDSAQLHAAVPRIIGYWRDWLRGSADSSPRTGERGLRERAFVSAVIEAALARASEGLLFQQPDRRAAQATLEYASQEYGAAARRKRLDPQDLCDELGLLRHAIWRCVQEQHADDDERLRFLAALDNTISLAVQATLRGGYRAEFDEHTRGTTRDQPAAQ